VAAGVNDEQTLGLWQLAQDREQAAVQFALAGADLGVGEAVDGSVGGAQQQLSSSL
jgi:hypothetical protein